VSFKLFSYPQQAAFGKILPKSKIYEFAKPSNAVKELFVKQIEQIIWGYKLSPETINIPAGEGVQEIQVFKIQSKVPEIDEDVLRAIDEAIPSHIFYEITFGHQTRLIAAYKRLSEVDSARWVTGAYFYSTWVASASDKKAMPIALNMGGLYSQMIRTLMMVSPRSGESLKSQAERLELLRMKNLELKKLKFKLEKEKQFNRKVVINSQIKELKNLINSLT
jgi:hypothetical protein